MPNKKLGDRRSVHLSYLLNDLQWHSSLSFDTVVAAKQRGKQMLKNTSQNRRAFISAGHLSPVKFASSRNTGQPGELLIHKSDRALWRISDDGRRIEPAFSDDVITIGEDEDE